MERVGHGVILSHEFVDGWLDSLGRADRDRALDIIDEVSPRVYGLVTRSGAAFSDAILVALLERALGD